jgi:hypothetical protein
MFGKTMSRALVVITALSLVIMSVGTALADTIQVDGDIASNGVGNTIVCGLTAGTGRTVTANLNLKYNAQIHFNDGTVTISAALDGNRGSTFISAQGGSLSLSGWGNGSEVNTNLTITIANDWATKSVSDTGPYKIQYTLTQAGNTYVADLGANMNAVIINGPDCGTGGNSAPVLGAVGDKSVAEGSTLSFTLSATDANAGDTLTYSMSGDVAGMSVNSSTGAFSWTPGDNYVRSVTFSVSDGTASDSEAVTITSTNVAPTTSNAAFAADATTPFKFNASFNYSDVGWLDTHAGSSISWTVNGASYAATSTVSAAADALDPPQTGSVASSITLGPGCYTIAASGTVLDDDLDSSAVSFTTGFEETPLDVPTAAFLAPIKDNERNFAKWGNVLPVKVSLMSSCNPGQQLSANLYLSYIQGNSGETITGDEVITTSVSAADSGNLMRLNDSFYIYNFATKPLTAGKDYTLRVRYGSATGPILLAAVLNLKK